MSYCRLLTFVLAIFCLLPIATLGQTAAAAQNSPAPLGKLIDVGGYRVHLYCIGAGSPAVVIVGAGYSFDWGLVQPEVAEFTQVCTYDHSGIGRSEEHTSELQSLTNLVCRLLLEKKKNNRNTLMQYHQKDHD